MHCQLYLLFAGTTSSVHDQFAYNQVKANSLSVHVQVTSHLTAYKFHVVGKGMLTMYSRGVSSGSNNSVRCW